MIFLKLGQTAERLKYVESGFQTDRTDARGICFPNWNESWQSIFRLVLASFWFCGKVI